MNESTERWLPVVRYEGWYEVSDWGRVRNAITGKILKTKLSGRGYLTVCLCRNGHKIRRPVHLLVLEAFVGPPAPGQEGRHGPNGKLDNRLTELCWGTRKQNLADRERDGTVNEGVRHGNAKLTEADVLTIRARAAAGEYLQLIALDYGIGQENVSLIVRRETWDHVAGSAWGGRNSSGSRNNAAKITENDVRKIRRLAASGISQRELAKRFAIKDAAVSKIVLRRTWNHVL